MVAKITRPLSIKRALNYNEQKVSQGKAFCIDAMNFIQSAEHLNFYNKLVRFEDLISMNKRCTANTLHVSLNFSREEKLEEDQLAQIARTYMEKIGFGAQPYLVYEHLDAGHPHVHIVSTNIQSNGSRIPLHNLGKNASSRARKEIEVLFNLKKAERETNSLALQQEKEFVQKAVYGTLDTKRSITNVLEHVLLRYNYSSLPELNAVLRLYNVEADRGRENGRIYQAKGLAYRILDEKGNKVGVPIKASSIYFKPTLAFLEKQFRKGQEKKEERKKLIKQKLDWVLIRPTKNLQSFKQALEREKIHMVIRQNNQGIIYGLTYIDHNLRSVFNGSELGKAFSAKAVMERLTEKHYLTPKPSPEEKIPQQPEPVNYEDEIKTQLYALDTLLTPQEPGEQIPRELKKPKKKKKQSL